MAPHQLQYYYTSRKVLLYLLLFFFTSTFVSAAINEPQLPLSNQSPGTRRTILDLQKQVQPVKKSSASSSTTKNQSKLPKITSIPTKNNTKLVKTTSVPTKNHTKLIKTSTTTGSAKNQTKLVKLTLASTKNKTKLIKPTIKKLNSTSKTPNSAKPTSNPAKKPSDLAKSSSPKNKTTKPITPKPSKTQSDKKLTDLKSKNPDTKTKKPKPQITQKPTQPIWIDQEDSEPNDLVKEFRDLPSKLQETLLPDLERISNTSKVYLNRANKEITKGFKPIVGTKYAPTIASIISFSFILIPLVLVSLIFTRIKAYFSLQKLLIFIQVYLSIYFSILCLSSLVTGLEPLRFFYATSQSTYVCLQVLQTLGYALYLLLLLMYLVLVFSTRIGSGSRMLGLGQTFVGFSVGVHYYVTVFHRVVLRQPPKTNWRVHGIYATCFLVICVLARADGRKKAYLDGGVEGKKS